MTPAPPSVTDVQGEQFEETEVDDFGPNNENLPKQLKDTLEKICREAQGQEKSARRIEMLEGYQNRQYYGGNQYIYMRSSQDFCFYQAYPGASYSDGDSDATFGQFLDVHNIFTPFATIQSAKLTENNPPLNFQPEDPSQTEDIAAAQAAEGMRQDFDRQNDIGAIKKEFIYYLQCDGVAIIWNKTEENESLGRKIGTCEVFGAVECKRPIYATKRKDFWYVIRYDDLDIKIAKDLYPQVADKLQAGKTCLSEGEYERLTRLGIVRSAGSGMQMRAGESITHLITRGYFWLRPAAWSDKKEAYIGPDDTVTDEDGEERPKQVRDKLSELFPKGVRACFVGDEFIMAPAKSMDKELIIAHAYIGKGQNRMPILTPLVTVQDKYNKFMNRADETASYSNDETWLGVGDEEYAAITKQQSQPGAYRQLKNLLPDQDIRTRVQRIQGFPWDPSWQKFTELLQTDLPQFQLSVPPSIWGESVKGNDTASGLQLISAQAMGVLGHFWVVMVAAFAEMYQHNCQAILDDDDYPDAVTVQLGEGNTVKVEKETLAAGQFKVFPDIQSGFPQSIASEKQTLNQVLELLMQTPLGPQITSAPENAAYYLRVNGLPELVIPEKLSADKQQREIDDLVKGSPIVPPAIAQMLDSGAQIADILDAIQQQAAQAVQAAEVQRAGQAIATQAHDPGAPPPAPVQPPDPEKIARPSIRVWPSDFHNFEAAKCKDWLSSDVCRREQDAGNIRGIFNVMLHMREHEMMAAKEAPAPPPMMPPRGKPQGVGPAPPMPAPAAPNAPGVLQ